MKKIIKKFFKENKWKFLLLVFLVILFSITNIIFGVTIKYILDNIAVSNEIVYFYVGLFIAVRFVTPLIYSTIDYICSSLSDKLDVNIKKKYYFYILNINSMFHNDKNTGEIINKLVLATDSIRNINRAIFITIVPVIIDIFFIVGIIFFYFNAVYAFLVLSILCIYAASIVFNTNKRVPILREIADSEKKMIGFFHDSFINHEGYKIFSDEKHEEKKLVVF